jgi:hypothetical protein
MLAGHASQFMLLERAVEEEIPMHRKQRGWSLLDHHLQSGGRLGRRWVPSCIRCGPH